MLKRFFISLIYIIPLLFLSCQKSQTESPQNATGEMTRHPVVSGTFYPRNPTKLKNTITKYLDAVPKQNLPGKLVALIAPHAGYIYSGSIAAYAFNLLKENEYPIVIVLAPSHRASFQGGSVYPQGWWRTPLGDVEVDNSTAQKILATSKQFHASPLYHSQEHSLEVEIPFLQMTTP